MAWSWWRRAVAVAWKYVGADSQWTAGAVRAAAAWQADDDPEAHDGVPRAAERRAPPRHPDESGT